MWLFLGISAIIFTGLNLICSFKNKITDNDLKSLCSVDALYLVFSTASAEDNIRNPRSESGISYIGSNTHSLAERGSSAIRVWTPAGHKLVVLHDKGARRILSP